MPFIWKKNKECFFSRQAKWSTQIMEGGLWGNLKWQYILIWQTRQWHWMTLLSGRCSVPECPALHAGPQAFYCPRLAKPCHLNDLSKSLFSVRLFCSHTGRVAPTTKLQSRLNQSLSNNSVAPYRSLFASRFYNMQGYI